mgnify:CR=1 FL=1
MKIESFRLFTTNEYPKLAELLGSNEAERFFSHLNDQLTKLTNAQKNRLTLTENLNFSEQTFKVRHDTEYEAEPTVIGKVKSVEVVDSELYDYTPNVAWYHKTANTVAFKVAWDSAPTDEQEVTLRFEGRG